MDHRAFIRLHALETNIMEGIFSIDESVSTILDVAYYRILILDIASPGHRFGSSTSGVH